MDSMNGYYENGIFLGYLTLFFRGFKKISCGKFRFRLTASRNKNTKKVSSVLFFFSSSFRVGIQTTTPAVRKKDKTAARYESNI